jgi:hypothetical protein
VVKLFYLVAIAEWLESGMTPPSTVLDRQSGYDRDSSNDATNLVLDILSGSTSGPELPTGPFETWTFQRNIVNRYFHSPRLAGTGKINVNQKLV